jgi:hypothetical protein
VALSHVSPLSHVLPCFPILMQSSPPLGPAGPAADSGTSSSSFAPLRSLLTYSEIYGPFSPSQSEPQDMEIDHAGSFSPPTSTSAESPQGLPSPRSVDPTHSTSLELVVLATPPSSGKARPTLAP